MRELLNDVGTCSCGQELLDGLSGNVFMDGNYWMAWERVVVNGNCWISVARGGTSCQSVEGNCSTLNTPHSTLNTAGTNTN